MISEIYDIICIHGRVSDIYIYTHTYIFTDITYPHIYIYVYMYIYIYCMYIDNIIFNTRLCDLCGAGKELTRLISSPAVICIYIYIYMIVLYSGAALFCHLPYLFCFSICAWTSLDALPSGN